MNGFIDPSAQDQRRLDRLEVLIDEALKHIGLNAFSPEVQAIVRDLNSDYPARVARARDTIRADMDAGPVLAAIYRLTAEVASDE